MKEKENKSTKRKILKIKNGEYLLEVKNNAAMTTYNKDVALDISDWDFNQIAFVISNLHKVGYVEAKVEEIEEAEKIGE